MSTITTVTVTGIAKADQETVFTTLAAISLPSIFTGMAPFPAVLEVHNNPGRWNEVGLTRNSLLSDGTTIDERLTSYEPNERFSYQVTGITSVFRHVVTMIEGQWNIQSDGQSTTRIIWVHSLHAKPGRSWLLRYILAPLWRKYMERALALAIISIGQTQ